MAKADKVENKDQKSDKSSKKSNKSSYSKKKKSKKNILISKKLNFILVAKIILLEEKTIIWKLLCLDTIFTQKQQNQF